MITEDRLKELEALVNAATGGKWWVELIRNLQTGGFYVAVKYSEKQLYGNVTTNLDRHDAEFIAAARSAVPELIAEVRRLRRMLYLMTRLADWQNEGYSIDEYRRFSAEEDSRQSTELEKVGKWLDEQSADHSTDVGEMVDDLESFMFTLPEKSQPVKFFDDEARRALEWIDLLSDREDIEKPKFRYDDQQENGRHTHVIYTHKGREYRVKVEDISRAAYFLDMPEPVLRNIIFWAGMMRNPD